VMDEVGLRAAAREHAELVSLLDRGEALRAALALLTDGADVAWVAEPDEDGDLVLRQILGDRTGMLRGLHVPAGLGLTGKVSGAARPAWVDDYLASSDITHTFDQHIHAEGIERLLAVPVVRDHRVLGVLAIGVRDPGAFSDRAVDRANVVAGELALAVAVADRARLAREVAVHEERRRMATELHDSVGALLFAIGSGAAGIAETAAGDPDLAARVELLRRHAADASTALRASLRTLHASPSALALSVTLREDCAAFTDRTGVPAELVILDDDPPALPPARTQVLVAAVREALLNVEKHADAGAVVVSVSRRVRDDRAALVVAVTDDGVGLDDQRTAGLGLTAATQAVGRLGGTLRVTADPYGGTMWRVELPC
jgi:LuxR family transcriptional regulator, regulator of acetate metabolism